MSAPLAWLIFLLALIVAAPSIVPRLLARLGEQLDRLNRFPLASEGFVFVIVAALGAIPTILNIVPPPSTPDEFSYLLAGDTFAHGRLTNQRHGLWEHFETWHVLSTPTYSSKYPPAQGLTLALGQVLWRPVVGAWLCAALAAAATGWMLRGAFPTRWAILGGLLAGLHPQVFWWGQIYWGGSTGMAGGALLCGSAIRIVKRPNALHAAIGAIGIVILANSRAYQGLILTLLVAVTVSVTTLRANSFLVMLRKTAWTALPILVAATSWMLYYNWRVTGDPLQMPYTLYASQYQVAPLFYWQSPRPTPEYRHRRIADYWTGYDLNEWKEQATWPGFFRGAGRQLTTIVQTYLHPPTLWLALLGFPFAMLRRRIARIAASMILAFLVIHIATTPWMRMHYLGPVVPLFAIVLVGCLMQLVSFRIAAAIVVVQFTAVFVLIHQMATNERPLGYARAQLVQQLQQEPGEHLVIVEYSSAPQQLFEWIYNDADIDSAKIVFAHDMGQQRNQALLGYFSGRRVWKLFVDGNQFEFREVSGLRKSPPFATRQSLTR